jgi:hypothetical protein
MWAFWCFVHNMTYAHYLYIEETLSRYPNVSPNREFLSKSCQSRPPIHTHFYLLFILINILRKVLYRPNVFITDPTMTAASLSQFPTRTGPPPGKRDLLTEVGS